MPTIAIRATLGFTTKLILLSNGSVLWPSDNPSARHLMASLQSTRPGGPAATSGWGPVVASKFFKAGVLQMRRASQHRRDWPRSMQPIGVCRELARLFIDSRVGQGGASQYRVGRSLTPQRASEDNHLVDAYGGCIELAAFLQ